jgi:hypothetical protein
MRLWGEMVREKKILSDKSSWKKMMMILKRKKH